MGMNFTADMDFGDQAAVVQRADNFIQWINCYPADKMYWLEYILSAD